MQRNPAEKGYTSIKGVFSGVTYVQRWGHGKSAALRGRPCSSLVFLLESDTHTGRDTRILGWFWLTGCHTPPAFVSTTAITPIEYLLQIPASQRVFTSK